MGDVKSPKHFQQKMKDLFHGFEFISAYIYDFLVLKSRLERSCFKKHLNKMKKKGLKINTEKSFFRQTEMEYLGFWVKRDGVKPIDKKYKQFKI